MLTLDRLKMKCAMWFQVSAVPRIVEVDDGIDGQEEFTGFNKSPDSKRGNELQHGGVKVFSPVTRYSPRD